MWASSERGNICVLTIGLNNHQCYTSYIETGIPIWSLDGRRLAYRVKQGEEWHLDDDSTTLQMLRDSRAHKPNWSDSLDEFLNEYNIDKIHTSIIASHLGFDDKKPPDSFSKDLKNWMEKRGWKSGQFRSNGKKGRGYIK